MNADILYPMTTTSFEHRRIYGYLVGVDQWGQTGIILTLSLVQKKMPPGSWRAGRPCKRSADLCREVHRQTANGPVSVPARARSGAFFVSQAAITSRQLAIYFSATIRSASSTTQIAVASCETSSAAWLLMAFSLRLRSEDWFSTRSVCELPISKQEARPAITPSGPP